MSNVYALRPGADSMVGKTVDEYRVVKLLGAGGFGRVFLVLQQPIMLMAALKLISRATSSA